jgi:hypothetical protein
MGLNPKSNDTYVYKLYSPKNGWAPAKTTWFTTGTNWLSPPSISTYDSGKEKGKDVHTWGVGKDGRLYYSYFRNGLWWPKSGSYYSILRVPGIAAQGILQSGPQLQTVMMQDELK